MPSTKIASRVYVDYVEAFFTAIISGTTTIFLLKAGHHKSREVARQQSIDQ